ncbi:MAG: NADH-quinone oxidoreductase subunit NuoH [Candidatus Schekmanbacteria bacterium]|nr:NADH-quinone oxidoreductase subunit NuoH [Candidatus Schekmanbacteria bacterium]
MDMIDVEIMLAKVLLIVLMVLQAAPIMAWVERRGAALIQNRLGPNRVGPLGLFQSIADAIKAMFKEDLVPAHVSRFYYLLAPIACLIPAFMTFAVIPMAAPITIEGRSIHFQVADLNVGILYVFAVASLGVFGIIMAGWSSNNKFSLLGSLRSCSQMISYELSLGLSVVALIMVYASVHLGEIVQGQAETLLQLGPIAIPKLGIFVQPLGFLLFLTAVHAETNRLPFDLPEGETEIVAGYHTEYGPMGFSLFMMAEYGNMLTASGLLATLYFGGWQMLPGFAYVHGALGLSGNAHILAGVGLQFLSLLLKVIFFMLLFVWTRWTLPRFRYDQVMDLGWKVMFPLSLVNIFITGALIYLGWI